MIRGREQPWRKRRRRRSEWAGIATVYLWFVWICLGVMDCYSTIEFYVHHYRFYIFETSFPFGTELNSPRAIRYRAMLNAAPENAIVRQRVYNY